MSSMMSHATQSPAHQAALKKRLGELLAKEGWSATRLAAETGASYFSALNWKNKDRNISPAYCGILARIFEQEGV